jgi:hypothetical protein
MKLITKDIQSKIPKLYATEGKHRNEIKVPLKLFNALGSQRWYIIEMDPENNLCFGFANLGDDCMAELGYISITELERIDSYRFKLERDRAWDSNTTLEKVMDFSVR